MARDVKQISESEYIRKIIQKAAETQNMKDFKQYEGKAQSNAVLF